MQRFKKNDTVIVTTGKSKGHVGKVLKVLKDQILVEGANFIKKHKKPNPQINFKGGIIAQEAFLDISNVAMYNPVTKKADKVGFKYLDKEGVIEKVRYFKSNQEIILNQV